MKGPGTSIDRFREAVRREVRALVSASDDQIEALVAHYALLVRWNPKLNLTRVVDAEAAARKHYGESALVASCLPAGPLRVADIGSGAGFPGIPVAVLRADVSVSLVECDQRKAVFLKEATRSLPNCTVLCCRAEALDDQFEWVISRAVRIAEVLSPCVSRYAALLISDGDARLLGSTWNVKRCGEACVAFGTVPRET